MTDLALAGVARRSIGQNATIRTTTRHTLSADVLAGVESYFTVAADWRRLLDLQSGTVLFQSPALLAAWAGHFARGRGRSLATIVVRHEARPVLIWPLCMERRALVSVATGAGGPIGQYDEILLDPDYDGKAALAVAIDALRHTLRPDFLFLERVRADGALRTALGDAPPLSWTEGAPYSDLSRGTAALRAGLRPRVVRQQRKRVRRFSNEGSVEFAVAENRAEAQEWLTEAMTLKREWLRSTGRVSRAFVRPETANCLAELAATLSSPGVSPRMVVSRLTLDGRTAAIEMGFCHRGIYHLYLGAFAPECARFGPGNVLTEHVLEWCAANGIAGYDMLAPRSRNKGEWQSGEVAVLDFALPMTTRGRLYVATVLKRLSPALRDSFYALPAPLRSAVAGMTLRI